MTCWRDGDGVMGASNGRAHYLAGHLLLGGRTCLSVPDTDTLNRPGVRLKMVL